jgi:hypothetical protein
MIKMYRPILDVDFFKQLLKDSEEYRKKEEKQKEQELERFAEIIADKVVEKLRKKDENNRDKSRQ